MRACGLIIAILLALAIPASAAGTPEPLDDVVNDYSQVLDAPTEAKVDAEGAALWDEHDASLVIVVLPKMADYDDLPQIDFVPFTNAWVTEWEFESTDIADRAVFLFVSTGDRTARIALGPAFVAMKELDIQMVLIDHFLPHVRKDDWNAGVLDTALALGQLVRDHPPAPLPTPAETSTDDAPTPGLT